MLSWILVSRLTYLLLRLQNHDYVLSLVMTFDFANGTSATKTQIDHRCMHSYIYLWLCGRSHRLRKYWHILPMDSFEFCLLWFRHFSYRYVGDLMKGTFLFSFFFYVVTWFCKSFSVFSIFCCLHSESHQSVITHFSYFSPVENSNWHDIYLQFVLHFILNHRSWFLYTSSSNDDFVVTTCNSGFVVCIEFSIISLKFFFF